MLPVYFEDKPVGRLEDERGGLTFSYADEWLAQPSAFPISITMPLRREPYERDIATPWFANLLPEERQLERIGRLLGRSEGDVYGLLEDIGRETAGALSIGAPEPPGDGAYRPLSESDLAEAIGNLPQRPLLAGEDGVTMSLAGAQSKLTVAKVGDSIFLPLHGAASTHILKPESERLYASVENELLCMSLARTLRLPTAPVSMGWAGDRRYLLVQRYDRSVGAPRATTQAPISIERQHQEDFCQVFGKFPTEKYEARRGPGFAAMFEAITEHTRSPAPYRLGLLDLIILACCIGDVDRHAKNYALLFAAGGPVIAPGYDLMSALLYDNVTRNLAMRIGGKNRAEHLERRHWMRFARDVRLAPAGTVRRVGTLATAVAERVDRVAAELGEQYVADRQTFALFAERIRERAERVAANSQRDTTSADDE